MNNFFKYIFHPVIFSLLFFIVYLLYLLRLSDSLSILSLATDLYILSGILIYTAGVFLGYFYKTTKIHTTRLFNYKKQLVYNRSVFSFIKKAYLITMLFFTFEYIVFFMKYGTIPLLSSDAELVRFDFAVNGYIHLISMSSNIFLFLLVIAYFIYHKNNSKLFDKYFVMLAIVISFLYSIGLSHRGTIIIFIMYTVIAFSFFHKIKLKNLLMFGILALYLIGLAKLIRDYAYYGEHHLGVVADDWYFGDNILLLPLHSTYLSLTMNLNILNAYILNLDEHYYGYFTFVLPFLSVLPGHEFDLKDLQRTVLHTDFHGLLTNTILGIPYVDFGFFGLFFMLIIGIVLGRMYKKVVYNRLLRDVLPYSYLYSMVLLGVYSYRFTGFHILFYFVIIFFISRKIDKYIWLRTS